MPSLFPLLESSPSELSFAEKPLADLDRLIRRHIDDGCYPGAQIALADFDHAVGLMRAGNQTQAEQEFQALAVSYPTFAGPEINLGILFRKEGRLEQSEQHTAQALMRATRLAQCETGLLSTPFFPPPVQGDSAALMIKGLREQPGWR